MIPDLQCRGLDADELIIEIGRLMALRAFGLLEQLPAAQFLRRQGGLALQVAVIAAVRRDHGALEGADGLEDVLPGQRIGLGVRKRLSKTRRIIHVLGTGQALQHLLHGTVVHAHLDGFGTEHGVRDLGFQRHQHRIGPGLCGMPGHVAQPHGIAGMLHVGDAARTVLAVGKGTRLFVTRGTRHGAITREAPLMEQVAPQRHLGSIHGVVSRHTGCGHVRRKLPLPGVGRAVGRIGPVQHGRRCCLPLAATCIRCRAAVRRASSTSPTAQQQHQHGTRCTSGHLTPTSATAMQGQMDGQRIHERPPAVTRATPQAARTGGSEPFASPHPSCSMPPPG